MLAIFYKTLILFIIIVFSSTCILPSVAAITEDQDSNNTSVIKQIIKTPLILGSLAMYTLGFFTVLGTLALTIPLVVLSSFGCNILDEVGQKILPPQYREYLRSHN